MPSILAQSLYIDIFTQGLEVAIRQMIDVISGNNTFRKAQSFHNVRAYIQKINNEVIIEFRTEVYMEPQSKYLILLKNSKNDLVFKAIGESQFESNFQEEITLSDGRVLNGIFIGRPTPTSPQFPFIVKLTPNENKEIYLIDIMIATSRDQYDCIPMMQ